MKFLLDSHTHTLASGHAYCTLLEMVRAAAERELELICITDHAPGMELTTHRDYFLNFKVIDREIYGVKVLMGAELNVMDFEGTVDLPPKLLNNLDMAVASQHIWCMPQGGDADANTQAMVRAMDTCPKICILGHPDDGRYPLDYPALVRSAGERDVLLEVNNTSLSPTCSRVNSTANVNTSLDADVVIAGTAGERVVIEGRDVEIIARNGELDIYTYTYAKGSALGAAVNALSNPKTTLTADVNIAGADITGHDSLHIYASAEGLD